MLASEKPKSDEIHQAMSVFEPQIVKAIRKEAWVHSGEEAY